MEGLVVNYPFLRAIYILLARRLVYKNKYVSLPLLLVSSLLLFIFFWIVSHSKFKKQIPLFQVTQVKTLKYLEVREDDKVRKVWMQKKEKQCKIKIK